MFGGLGRNASQQLEKSFICVSEFTEDRSQLGCSNNVEGRVEVSAAEAGEEGGEGGGLQQQDDGAVPLRDSPHPGGGGDDTDSKQFKHKCFLQRW